MVGADFLSFTGRWPSPSEGGSGKNPSSIGVGNDGDDASGSLGALTKCPAHVTADAGPQLSIAGGRRPPPQCRPPLGPAQSRLRMNADPLTHLCVGERVAGPQPQRQGDRGRRVAFPRKRAAWPHDDDRAALAAPVAPLRQLADLRCSVVSVRSPSLSNAHPMAVQDHASVGTHPGRVAPRTSLRPHIAHVRRRFLPRLDVDPNLDDTGCALGVLFQDLDPPGSGRGRCANTSPPFSLSLGSPARSAYADSSAVTNKHAR